MAQRRMISSDIVGSEEFLNMPVSSQLLYFHLSMRADDDGFIQPKLTMRMVGTNDDDLKILIAKRFLLTFESGVVVIKHWLIHNLIRADLYKETRFKDEKQTLGLNKHGAYTELREGVVPLRQIEAPEWLKKRRGDMRTANVPQTALRIGKDRIGKDRISEDKILLPPQKKFVKPTIEEIKAYCIERNNSIDPVKWFDHYESNGWKVGRNSMKDWKAAVRTWEGRSAEFSKTNQPRKVLKI